MERILVIGGNGFVGGNVVDELLEKNYEVGVYDIEEGENPSVKYYKGNVLDDNKFEEIIKRYSTIVYLISAIMPQKAMQEPLSSYKMDIPLLIHVLEICVKNGIKRIVYSSSGGTIYGNNMEPNKEEKLPNPINHYAICKLACERILCLYNKLYNMQNVILRIANPYGNGQRLESGVGVITTFTRHVLNRENIILFGDGENIRDYIDIADVAKAFQLSIEWNFSEAVEPVFNVGSGMGISINRIIEIISEELNVKPRISYMPQRKFDVRCNYLNMEKSKSILGLVNSGNPEQNIRKYVQTLRTSYVNSIE